MRPGTRLILLTLLVWALGSSVSYAADITGPTLSKWKLLFDPKTQKVTVHLRATDISDVKEVHLFYSSEQATYDRSVDMNYFGGDSETWTATLKETLTAGRRLYLRAVAIDQNLPPNKSVTPYPSNPYLIGGDTAPPTISNWNVSINPKSGKLTVHLKAQDASGIDHITLSYSIDNDHYDHSRAMDYDGGNLQTWTTTLPESFSDGQRVYLKATAVDQGPSPNTSHSQFTFNPYKIVRDTAPPSVTNWDIRTNPTSGKITVRVKATDGEGVERVGLYYSVGEAVFGQSKEMAYDGGGSQTWTVTLPENFTNGQSIYFRTTAEDVSSPPNTGFTDFPSNPYTVSSVREAAISFVGVTLNRTKVHKGESVTGQGTIRGEGHGVVTYHWIWRNPENRLGNSATITTLMRNGIANLPSYKLPADILGTYATWIETAAPSSQVASSPRSYTVIPPENRPPLTIRSKPRVEEKKVPDTVSPDISDWEANIDPVTGKLTARLTAADIANVAYIHLAYSTDPTTYNRSAEMVRTGKDATRWTATLPDTFHIGQTVYFRVKTEDHQHPPNVRTKDYVLDGYKTPYSPLPTVTFINIELNRRETKKNGTIMGNGTISGVGDGTIYYQWKWRKPGSVSDGNATLSAAMRNGIATIPQYQLPTDKVGDYTVWVAVKSPGIVSSADQRYLVREYVSSSSASWEVSQNTETGELTVDMRDEEATGKEQATLTYHEGKTNRFITMDYKGAKRWSATLSPAGQIGEALSFQAILEDRALRQTRKIASPTPYRIRKGAKGKISHAGVTIITHGLNVCEEHSECPSLPGWEIDMGVAVLKRAGYGKLWHFTPHSNSVDDITMTQTKKLPKTFENSRYGEQVILVDWGVKSNDPSPGDAEAVGHALYALLMGGGPGDPGHPESFVGKAGKPLHFIGHGTGAAVNSEAIQRLIGWENIAVEQMTLLDPNDWDQDVNKGERGAFMPDVRIWDKVLRVDTYYNRNRGAYPNGRPVPGSQIGQSQVGQKRSYNGLDLSGLPGFKEAAPSRVPAYYYGTIDPAATEVDGEIIRREWYPNGRKRQGYAYSRLGGRKYLSDFSTRCRITPLHPVPSDKCDSKEKNATGKGDIHVDEPLTIAHVARRIFDGGFSRQIHPGEGQSRPGHTIPPTVEELPGGGGKQAAALTPDSPSFETMLNYIPEVWNNSHYLTFTLHATSLPDHKSTLHIYLTGNDGTEVELFPVIPINSITEQGLLHFQRDISALNGQAVSIRFTLRGDDGSLVHISDLGLSTKTTIPVIFPLPAQTGAVGISYTSLVPMVGETPPSVWRLISGPKGMIINGDGSVHWDNPTGGSHLVTIRAGNRAGFHDMTWTLNIPLANPAEKQE